jgi:membrane peptidoglycan carboxypeptidase
MIFNSLNTVLAQAAVRPIDEPDLISSSYKFNIETICGVLLLLIFGIALGIWIGYKNVKGRKVRVYRSIGGSSGSSSSSRHRSSSSSRSKSKKSDASKTEINNTEKEESPAQTPELAEPSAAEPPADKPAEVEEEPEEKTEEKSSSGSSGSQSKSRKRRRRREHRPRGTTLAESGEGLPPPRPPGVPPPAFIKRDE